MKAKELMIGDWVKSRGKIEQVTSVYGGYICTDSFEDSHDDYFEPIPLTLEILKKNGFRKLVTYGTEKWVCNEVRLNVYDSGETWRFCADTNRLENSVIYICFVHQLQHALRLCGIEKEITI